MSFEEFEHLARLYVVGALDEQEMERFVEARKQFGAKAEASINEFRRLNSVFALSLRPHAPQPDTKKKLLSKIREAMNEQDFSNGGDGSVLRENHAEH